MKVINTILDLIFPTTCISCGKKGVDFCLNCFISSPQASRECAKWIFPLYDYRHPPIRKAIQFLKYKNKKRIANIFAEVLHYRILEEIADLYQLENFHDPVLIPIPLSKKRLRERGFNQALLICKKLTEKDQKKNYRLIKDILIKPKDTLHQAQIENRKERLRNIRGSFALKNEKRVKNKNIILIDDVVTTGATLEEAKRILKQAGAKKVIAFTIAH
jgi:competence protein ComFC